MGCSFSSTTGSFPNRATKEMYFVARGRALVAMKAIVDKYNEGLERPDRITARGFVSEYEYAPVVADRLKTTLESVGIDRELLWFIRHAIVVGPVDLPTAWGTPTAAGVLENIDRVVAPEDVKTGFVKFMASPFNADASQGA